MKNAMRTLLFVSTLLLCACGFHLRGHGAPVVLAFQSVYLKAGGETPFIEDLRNGLVNNNVAVGESSDQATITLEVVSESSDKQILSLSGAGKVLEYQLRYRVTLRAYDKQLTVWLPDEEILLMRTLTYDDTQVLAKEQEEAMLYKDMRSDAVSQALRRLSRAKPPKPSTPENAPK
jgi:LPS-assembly lipoprotein